MSKLKQTIYAFMNAYSQGRSGGDIRFIEIAKRWKNIDLTVITSIKGKELCQELRLKTDFKITSDEEKFTNIFLTYLVRTIRAIHLQIKNHKVILYSSSDFFPDVIPAYLLKNKDNKWISVIHHVYPHFSRREGDFITNFIAYHLQKFSFFLIKRKADGIIVVNEIVKKDLLHLGFSEEKIFVSSNGIDIIKLNKVDKSNISYEGIYLGRLTYSKGVFDLIKIWQKVIEKIPLAKLAIIGEGSEKIKKELAELISNFKLKENIELLGYLPDEKAYSLLKSAKVFLFPSHEEGFGIAIIEAIACNLPVVAYDLSTYPRGIKKFINRINLYDKDDFSEAVSYLLTNKNGKLYTEEDAINFIKQYSWEKIAKNEFDYISK